MTGGGAASGGVAGGGAASGGVTGGGAASVGVTVVGAEVGGLRRAKVHSTRSLKTILEASARAATRPGTGASVAMSVVEE